MHIRKIDPREREEITKYLMLDENMLYSLVPPYLAEYEGTVFTVQGQIDAGREKFQMLRPRLRVKICEEWELCKRIDDPILQDEVNLVIAIADILSTITTGIPPFLVASILVRIGLRNFCNCIRQKG